MSGPSSKHTPTPGEWGAECYDRNGDWTVWVEPARMACIATVHAGVLPEGSVAANAHLVAAAPLLLEALEKARAALADLGACDDPICPTPQCGRVLVAVDDALAKARGGA